MGYIFYNIVPHLNVIEKKKNPVPNSPIFYMYVYKKRAYICQYAYSDFIRAKPGFSSLPDF